MLGRTKTTEPAPATGLAPLLKELRRRPAHVANRHPAPTRQALSGDGKYAQLALSDPLLPTVHTGIRSVDSTWNHTNRQFSGLVQMGTTSVFDIIKAVIQGLAYGGIVGAIGGAAGLGFQLIGSASTRSWQKFRHWGQFTLGMMAVGSLLGATLRGYHAVSERAKELTHTLEQNFQ